MFQMKRTLPILALLAVILTASAADKWTKVQSKNFMLVGNANENQIREVAENLELFRTAYSRFFTLQERAASVGTIVVVFKTDDSFRPYKPLYQGRPANVAGYFQGGQDVNYIALSADIKTPRVIYHEYVHQLMSDNLASLPPWFQEGFAECFSTLEIEGKDKKIRMGRAIGEHVGLLSQRRFMPLEQLFAVTQESKEYNEEEKQGLFYAESWALVHYMMLGPKDRRDKFLEFLNGLNKGTSAPAVFQRVFQTDLPSFQKVFEAYILQQESWPAMEISSPGRLDRKRDMTAKTLSEAQAEFYLGDLLLHSSRIPEGEVHLRNAVRLDPMLADAQSGMGRLLLRQNKETEAMAYLRRATELDPKNYLTHYYYASSIQSRNRTQTEEDWSTARSELLKAIELAPQFVAATEMLANMNLSRNAECHKPLSFAQSPRVRARQRQSHGDAGIRPFAHAGTRIRQEPGGDRPYEGLSQPNDAQKCRNGPGESESILDWRRTGSNRSGRDAFGLAAGCRQSPWHSDPNGMQGRSDVVAGRRWEDFEVPLHNSERNPLQVPGSCARLDAWMRTATRQWRFRDRHLSAKGIGG